MSFGFTPVTLILALGAVSMLFLWIMWCSSYGWIRGTLAACCRLGWIIPIFLAFFPEVMMKPLPKTITLNPIHILLDDSDSMKTNEYKRNHKQASRYDFAANNIIEEIKSRCESLGSCVPKVTRFSEINNEIAVGFTPFRDIVEGGGWLYKLGRDPWMIISDGGDWRPGIKWGDKLKVVKGREARGLVMGFMQTSGSNKWIDTVDVPPVAFEEKPISINAIIGRAEKKESNELVQIQVLIDDSPVSNLNIEFLPDDLSTEVQVVIPPQSRGQHLLVLKILPTGDETSLWDNVTSTQFEVLPNTVGVLHLLGAPCWDGRFVRRFLKSEPKYDLISFFILRDPWDSQEVNERELSLIPFPVERLFKEELNSFRAVVIQNFALFQFLQHEYQQNLVQFIKDGGGLLFIGGPRALQSGDLASSALSEILPFDLKSSVSHGADTPGLPNGNTSFEMGGKNSFEPSYDPNIKFKIKLAEVDEHKRELANVYDEWEPLSQDFDQLKFMEGVHHMENVSFKNTENTPLLDAVKQDGKKIPLAVASYPGKGRAIWVFSDSFWRMAMGGGEIKFLAKHITNF